MYTELVNTHQINVEKKPFQVFDVYGRPLFACSFLVCIEIDLIELPEIMRDFFLDKLLFDYEDTRKFTVSALEAK